MPRPAILVFLAAVFAAACTPTDDAPEDTPISLIRLDLDRADPERLLRYYGGGYTAEDGADPFEAGLIEQRDGAFFLNRHALTQRHPNAAAHLGETSRLDWDALAEFLNATYYDARALPPTLAALREETPYDGDGWLKVEIDGVMTTARRRVFVAEDALRQALRHYHENGEQVIYPVGTTIVGEHWLDGAHAETTVMRKRGDGFWDFMTYDAEGRLAPQTETPPRALKTPTQCAGCHFGGKLFEPERSFPGQAPDGPHGPRTIHVGDPLRDAEVVRFFDEHRKRSDTILGLYATLFVSDLRVQREAGTLASEDAELLASLGL